MQTVAFAAPVAILGGVKSLPKAPKKVTVARVVRKAVVASAAKRNSAVVAAPVAAASLLAAAQVQAAEIAIRSQEIAEVADITPVFYLGFLVAVTAATVGTFVFLNKAKII
mmetsp:Transcript_27841/g.38483  ORF Transcript_27841/g.38483 Transcript_27841/m.38483 type:complete len:111 (-) Transcript_27841:193-525(-)